MNYNRSPVDSNEHVKLPNLQMSRTSVLELTNSPNSFYRSQREPNDHLQSPNLQISGTSEIKLPNPRKSVTYGSQMNLSNYQICK